MRYYCQVQIRNYEIGPDGALHHGQLMRLLQHAATYASDIAGMDSTWYTDNRTAWVLRGLRAQYLTPAYENDVIDIETWLSDVRRVRGNREYVLRRPKDGGIIARAQADWVYVDRANLAPLRIPAEALAQFKHEPGTSSGMASWVAAEPIGEVYQHRRSAQHREIDMMRHVNNAVYFEWFEQAYAEATGELPANIAGHAIEFVRGAQLGDEVVITSQRTQSSQNNAIVWVQEIRHSQTQEVIAMNKLLAAAPDKIADA